MITKRGRPPALDRSSVRGQRIQVVCTTSEKDEIIRRAEAAEAESIGRYMVECSLGRPPKPKRATARSSRTR